MCLIFDRIGLRPKYMRPQVVDLPLDTCSVVTNPEFVLSLRFVVDLDINLLSSISLVFMTLILVWHNLGAIMKLHSGRMDDDFTGLDSEI